MECLNCTNELVNLPKKRAKVFCCNTCRAHYWQKVKKLEDEGKTAEQVIKTIKKTKGTPLAFKNGTLEIKEPDIVKWLQQHSQNKDATFDTEYNFGDDKFLVVEKYTQFPSSQKPINKLEAFTWLKNKAESDQKIKDAWSEHKLTI